MGGHGGEGGDEGTFLVAGHRGKRRHPSEEVKPVRPLSENEVKEPNQLEREEVQEQGQQGDGEDQREPAGVQDQERGRDDGLSQDMATGEDDEAEEGRVAHRAREAQRVSQREKDEHELTHTPFRAWCRSCVRGRAKNTAHTKKTEDEKFEMQVPRISMDYFFASQEDEKANQNPIIAMVDEQTGEKYARAVGQKGLGKENEMDWLIKDMAAELQSWGHTGGEGSRLIMKCDGEKAIGAVRDALGKFLGGRVVPEGPAKGESASNGVIEEAGKTIREFVRVFKEQVEEKASVKMESSDVILLWAVRWAAMNCSRYLVGKDGRTPYERRRGKKCRVPVVCFGETVWYKEIREAKERKEKLLSEWQEGIWLGHARSTNETIIGTEGGAIRAYAILRKTQEERWDADRIKKIKGTPQQPDPSKSSAMIPIKIRLGDQTKAQEEVTEPLRKEHAPRRLKITQKMLERYGYSEGCEGCRYKETGLREQRPHSEACRRRVEAAMEDDEEDKDKKDKRKQRLDTWLAEQVEQNDEHKKQEEAGLEDPIEKGCKKEAHQESEEDKNEAEVDEVGRPEQGPQGAKRCSSSEFNEEEAKGKSSEEEKEKVEGKRSRINQDEHEAKRSRAEKKQEVEEEERHTAKRGNEEQSLEAKRRKAEEKKGNEEEEGDRVKRSGEEQTTEAKRRKGMEDETMGIEEALKIASIEIAEVYSPPRVTEEAKRFGIKSGKAMDLTTGWDFTKEEDREKAFAYVEKEKPTLLIGSPMCTMFSELQKLSKWSEEKQRRWCEAVEHMAFAVKLYRLQLEQGRFFLHEHPEKASSWGLKEIEKLGREVGVSITVIDQCMYGLTTWGMNGKRMKAKKGTKFMTNSKCIGKELQQRCDGQHQHQRLVSGRAAEAARYPPELCRAICRGLMEELRRKEDGIQSLCVVRATDKVVYSATDRNAEHEDEDIGAWDDLSGEILDTQMVKKARLKEIEYVNDKKVWVKVKRSEAQRKGWKVIKGKWIDLNKGDKERPNYRSRYVGKEFNDGDWLGIFAATPPLEGLRLLLSEAATIDEGPKAEEKVVMINDVARAFFEALATRDICVELPDEGMTEDDKKNDMVGKLMLSLYGTRDAAANFQTEVKTFMEAQGFRTGKYNPCTYYHPKKKLKTLVHGDDFTTVGGRSSARWFKEKLEDRFEIKSQVVGRSTGEVREARVLNRIVRVSEHGWELEADQRHVDILVEAMNLKGANGVATPGEEEKEWQRAENEEELDWREAKRFQALAARANYLALDRADLQYPTKEVCRGMARPKIGDMRKLRRLTRYLISAPRLVVSYKWQGRVQEVAGYTDSDWAGCKRTARSTSGGALMCGSHYIRSWSNTQKSITLSSGEAELVALVKTSTEMIGILQLIADWGLECAGRIFADSSAALGVVNRKGNGKLRHVRVGMLWVQEREVRGELNYEKVLGANNPADLMTKHLNHKAMNDHMHFMNLRIRSGRAQSGLTVS